jgi:hypothetical protein
LQRIIRDEKEEAERKEGMEGAAMDGEDVSTREQMSTVGTPRQEPDGTTPMQTQEGKTHPKTQPIAQISSNWRCKRYIDSWKLY